MNQREQARVIWNNGLKQSPDNETLLQTMKRLNPQ
jgi:hypothetical protein